MARLPRPDIPGIPQHIVQRGNNRLPCLLDDEDRRRYLHGMKGGLRRYGCALHAYVLMSNHVHLLVTPAESGAVSRLMQTFGRNYARLFNARHRRTGTLWEGCFKSCLVVSACLHLVQPPREPWRMRG
jgi:putative transposase